MEEWWCFKVKHRSINQLSCVKHLAAESVKGSSLAFQCVDDVHSSNRLPPSVLSVGNCISDDVFKEYLENTTSFLVDQTGDTFNSTSACKASDRGLRDALDVIAEHLAMTFGAALAKSFSSFSTSRHSSLC